MATSPYPPARDPEKIPEPSFREPDYDDPIIDPDEDDDDLNDEEDDPDIDEEDDDVLEANR